MTAKNSNIHAVPLDLGYLCFTLDTDEDMARRVFKSRFGAEPEQVIVSDMLRVGPAPELSEEVGK